ncbi:MULTISPECIES: fumarylacetoacetate hydrolase family protein [unclassified Burkholderia]|uniref:fumarylacetoacetate hydrolase family protein n=1 Tax=unclassified Burkholderia TaxID=2613784 RepID=UPI000F5702DB|nr:MULTISPECIES: fumarylacetoacetate hydrolase family protein [unclassified Burkholderia]RQR70940.1 FAA hydrolase family protein [Burkholderia sp. Bp9011]RQR83703.1 FAA hydrolase family protein [Burkholderia sp. Bp9010]RQS64404.1 FAA hydrolase family protein [Burkholderia sp. Bp8977]
MKLASLKNGTRDGALIVVSRDLTCAVAAGDIAPTLQAAIDRWSYAEPLLRARSAALEDGVMADAFAFDPARVASPLPRAYQWLDGSAYLSHVELVRKARGAEMPRAFLSDPLMYQGSSDYFTGPRDPVLVESEDWGVDLEAEIAVITDDVPMLTPVADAKHHIKLLMLVNDVSLRHIIPGELNKGFGFLNGKGVTAFSPVAVTPDELGDAWNGSKVSRPLSVHINNDLLGAPLAGIDVYFDFPQLIAHAAKTRTLGAGTVIGSGTISNHDRSRGFGCISEKRALEVIEHGVAKTPFFRFKDRVRVEMFDANGASIFGAIENEIREYPG